jgi:hypothetical protein
MYGIDKGGLGNVIPCFRFMLPRTEAVVGATSQTSKPSERRRTTMDKDPDPRCTLISITQWQQKRYERFRGYVRGLLSQYDTGNSDSGRLAVQRQSVLHFFEAAPVSGEQQRLLGRLAEATP